MAAHEEGLEASKVLKTVSHVAHVNPVPVSGLNYFGGEEICWARFQEFLKPDKLVLSIDNHWLGIYFLFISAFK